MSGSRYFTRKRVLAAAILLAVLLLLQVVIGLLPKQLTLFDVTRDGRFSLSEASARWLRGVETPVTVYAITADGQIAPSMEVMLAQYRAACDKISVEVLHMEKDADFLADYVGASSLPAGSILVVSELRYRMISADAIEYYVITIDEEQMALTASEYRQMYEQYGEEIAALSQGYFCVEDAMVQAIDYVTAINVPHMYVLSGHGEQALGQTIREFFYETGLTYESLTLAEGEAVPADATTLLICAPTQDLSESETTAILDYLAQGGNLTLLTSSNNVTMPNLMRICASVGLSPLSDRVLLEGNANRYQDEPDRLLPEINTSHSVTATGAAYGYKLLLPQAHGIALPTTEAAMANVTLSALFVTSDVAYTKDENGKTQDTGAVALGVAAEHKDSGSKLVWISGAEAWTDEIIAQNEGNSLYLTMVLYWQSRSYEPTITADALLIESGAMESTSFATLLVGGVLMVALPATVLCIGMSARARRLRRQ